MIYSEILFVYYLISSNIKLRSYSRVNAISLDYKLFRQPMETFTRVKAEVRLVKVVFNLNLLLKDVCPPSH